MCKGLLIALAHKVAEELIVQVALHVEEGRQYKPFPHSAHTCKMVTYVAAAERLEWVFCMLLKAADNSLTLYTFHKILQMQMTIVTCLRDLAGAVCIAVPKVLFRSAAETSCIGNAVCAHLHDNQR